MEKIIKAFQEIVGFSKRGKKTTKDTGIYENPIHEWDISAEIVKVSDEKYTVKDTFKTKEYYVNELKENNKSLNYFTQGLHTGELHEPERYYSLIMHKMDDIIPLLYVVGAEYETVKNYVAKYLLVVKKAAKYYETLSEKLTYNETILALSLGYLYGIERSEMDWLEEAMVEEKYVDAVLDIIRNKVFKNEVGTKKDFYFKDKGVFGDGKKAKGELVDVINTEDKEVRSRRFAEHLEKVKEKHYRMMLRYYDEVDEDGHLYTGAQSFELTALAKILEVDKEQIADSKFIAEDLL